MSFNNQCFLGYVSVSLLVEEVRAYACSDIGKGSYGKILLSPNLHCHLCFYLCHCPNVLASQLKIETYSTSLISSGFTTDPSLLAKQLFPALSRSSPSLGESYLIPLQSHCGFMVLLFFGPWGGKYAYFLPRLDFPAVFFLPQTVVLSGFCSISFVSFPVALFPTYLQTLWDCPSSKIKLLSLTLLSA